MVTAILSLLSRTCLSGNRDILSLEYSLCHTLCDHLSKTPVNGTPCEIAEIKLSDHLRFYGLHERAVRSSDLIQYGEIKDCSAVGNCGDISCQLNIIVGMVALSHGGTFRIVIRNTRHGFIYLNSGKRIKTKQ